MTATEQHLPPEELARLGTEAYERHVRPHIRPEDHFKFVAIDVASGAYEIDRVDAHAILRLRARLPGAEIWLTRVGRPEAAYKFGLRR